jgi:hypothetical protein
MKDKTIKQIERILVGRIGFVLLVLLIILSGAEI